MGAPRPHSHDHEPQSLIPEALVVPACCTDHKDETAKAAKVLGEHAISRQGSDKAFYKASKAFIAAGGNVSAKDTAGNTPLHYAGMNGYAQPVKTGLFPNLRLGDSVE